MDSRKLFWSILLLAVFSSTAINWYLSWKTDENGSLLEASSSPDIVLKQISQLNFNDLGEQHFMLNAEEATHFIKRGMTEFLTPALIFYDQNRQSWDAKANAGLTEDSGDNFKLTGNVVIRKLGSDHSEIELHTDSMLISPKTEIAETQDEVEIFQGTNRTRSKGLRIEMHTGKLLLQSKVTSRYNPPAS